MIRTFAFRMSLLGSLLVLLAGCNTLQELLPDLTNPNVSLVSGATDGSTVNTNTVTFIVSATDDRSVATVTVRVGSGTTVACTLTTTARYECTTPSLSLGANTITVTATDGSGNSGTLVFTLTYERADGASDFDIEIIYFDESFTAEHKAAFDTAVTFWQSIVVGDIVDVLFQKPENGSCGVGEPAIDKVVDDLVIFATSFTDAPFGLLGSAGPCWSRTGSTDYSTTIAGFMKFDTEDLDRLATDGTLVATIAHEMGHVLGIGTNWESPGLDIALLDYTPSDDSPDCSNAAGFTVLPSYTGMNGVDAWQNLLGGSGNVPVEDEGGLGTQCGHWNDYDFGNELMTGYIDDGANPLSILSVRSLQDIAYTVDTSAAEAYSLPTEPGVGTQSAGGFNIAEAEILVRPRGGIDPATGESVTFPNGP